MKDIHRRKQSTGELCENTDFGRYLYDILYVRNLRNEISHELMHMDIPYEVKRHEQFIKDVRAHDNDIYLKWAFQIQKRTGTATRRVTIITTIWTFHGYFSVDVAQMI